MKETFEDYMKTIGMAGQATQFEQRIWDHQQAKIDAITAKWNALDKLTTEQHGMISKIQKDLKDWFLQKEQRRD